MGLLAFCSELSNSVFFIDSTVCPNINPIMLCTHVCDVNYAACYCLWSPTGICSRSSSVFNLCINDITHCSDLFELHLFADDTNLFYSNKNLSLLESDINTHLEYINLWLSCNKLSLNVTKTNFVIFHTPQKKLPFIPRLNINKKLIK